MKMGLKQSAIVVVIIVAVCGALFGLTWAQTHTDIKVVGIVDAVCKDDGGIWIDLRVIESSYTSIVRPNSYIKVVFNGTGPTEEWRAAKLRVGDLIQFTVRDSYQYFDPNGNWMISDLSWRPPCTDC